MNRNLYFSFLLLTLFSLLASGQVWANNELDGNEPFNSPSFFDNPEPKISIFPNPTTDFFEIQSGRSIDKIVVFNLIGRELRTFNAEVDRKYSRRPSKWYVSCSGI
ncbi:MAG: hypothetical protein R2769_13520 [Saprospiraceae bacterium]